VTITFPTAGRYIINTEFRRQGQMADLHSRQVLTVAGPAPAPVTLTEGPRSVVVDGVRVRLDGDPKAGGRSDLHYAFADAAPAGRLTTCSPTSPPPATSWSCAPTGRPSPTSTPRSPTPTAVRSWPYPARPSAPSSTCTPSSPPPGTYQLWAQFRLADGDLITVPFTVQAH
jgi:Cu+-exporting ATPase